MKLDCKYAQRFQILIVTHYSQTHKRAKQCPRPDERNVELRFAKVHLLIAFTHGVREPCLITWQRQVPGVLGGVGLTKPAVGE